MKFATPSIILLSIICNALSLDINRILWAGHHAQKTVEEARLVEIIRWRQPICLQPAPGVSPCVDSLRKFQKEYEQFSSKRSGRGREELLILTGDESGVPPRDEASGKLESPEIVASLPLEELQSSEEFFTEKLEQSSQRTSALTSEDRENPEGRYLIPPRETVTKHKQIYVTKVLDSPVTATLVAHNCLPDIGIPLCENNQDYVEPAASVPDLKPTLTISLNDESAVNERPTNSWESARNPTPNEPSVEAVEPSFEASRPLIENAKLEIIIRKPGSNQASTSFTLDEGSTTQIPSLQHIVIHNNNKARFSDIIRKPFSNLLPSNINFLEKLSQTQPDNQFTKPELDAELAKDVEATKTIEKVSSTKDDSSGKHKNPIFDMIYQIMNVTENSAVVQSINNFLHGNNQNKEESSAGPSHLGLFGIYLNPANFFYYKKLSTTAKPEVIVNIDPEVDVNVNSVAESVEPEEAAVVRPESSADVKSAISPDTNTESSAEVEPQVPANAGPEIAEDTKPEIVENVRPESSAGVKPLFSPDSNTESSAEVEQQVSSDARPEIAEDAKSENVEDVRPEIIIIEDTRPESSTDPETKFSMIVKREAIAVDSKPEFFSHLRPSFSTGKKQKFSTDAKTKFPMNVKGYSTYAKPRVDLNVKQEIAEDGEQEFSTDAKPQLAVDVKPEIAEYTEPEFSIVEFLFPQSSTVLKPIPFAEEEPKDINRIDIIEVPEAMVKETLLKTLAKPEDDVSDTFQTLDITQQTRDFRDVESLLKPVEKPSLFVDLLTNSTMLIDDEMRLQQLI